MVLLIEDVSMMRGRTRAQVIRRIGTGKTHLAIALGIEAARRRKRVLFTRAADLVLKLIEVRDDELTRTQKRL